MSTSATLTPPAMLPVRHMSSNPTIALQPSAPAKRNSVTPITPQRLSTTGSRSPTSIPSSPTSIHSSSSAIFERDIESPLSMFPSHSSFLTNPNARRSHTDDQSVPTVLHSAVEALEDRAAITIISPAPITTSIRSGIASPAWGSRSPSPTASLRSRGFPASSPQSYTSSLPIPRMSPPQLGALPASFESAAYSSPSGVLGSPGSSPFAHGATTPGSKSQNRLSFISYTDLLTSAPLSATTFNPTVTGPPPHLPEVSHVAEEVYAAAVGSSAASIHSARVGLSPSHPHTNTHVHFGHPAALVTESPPRELRGEWEREGLGKGLEARLEGLLAFEKLEKDRSDAFEKQERERGRVVTPAITST